MKVKIKHFMLSITLFFVCFIGISGAKADEISDIENQISENEDKYKDIQKQLKELEAAKDDLAAYIKELDESYAVIEALVDDLDGQIETKNAEIDEANKKIATIEEQLKEQYEDMKLRIKYMYESSETDYLTVFLSSGSINEILEQLEYISSIMEYDRQQMEKYEHNLLVVTELKTDLEKQKEELLVLVDEQDIQLANLDKLMAEAVENIASHSEQIADAEAMADSIEAEIDKQKNTVEKLKEEEEKRKQEQQNSSGQNGSSGTTGSYGSSSQYVGVAYQDLPVDIRRMAAIIWCEARGESYEGQVAVGTVVMNRVASPKFPNTIEGVISQRGQFTPYRSGKYAVALAKSTMQQSCIDAAIAVMVDGVRLGDWLFFRMKNGVTKGDYIGCHVFYK